MTESNVSSELKFTEKTTLAEAVASLPSKFKVFFRDDKAVIVYTESFDCYDGTPVYRFSMITNESVQKKIEHDVERPASHRNKGFMVDPPIRSIQMDREHDYDTPLNERTLRVRISEGYHQADVYSSTIAEIRRHTYLFGLMLDFAEEVEQEWADHDGSLTAEQEAHLKEMNEQRVKTTSSE